MSYAVCGTVFVESVIIMVRQVRSSGSEREKSWPTFRNVSC